MHNIPKNMRTCASWHRTGPGGCTYDHLKVLLDDEDLLHLLGDAAEAFAQAAIREEAAEALALSSMVHGRFA